jgi:hypothetical protein
LETKAAVKMNAEGLEKLIFTHIHFAITVKLENDMNEKEEKPSPSMKKPRRYAP